MATDGLDRPRRRIRMLLLMRCVSRTLLCGAVGFGVAFPALCHAEDSPVWRAVPSEDLSSTSSSFGPEIDAEIIFWNVTVRYHVISGLMSERLHYVRCKAFSPKGANEVGRVEIPYVLPDEIRFVQGRTVLPDGTELPLAPTDIHETTVSSDRAERVATKSFLLPGVVPGAIVEYRWTERKHYDRGLLDAFFFTRELPARQVQYRLHPMKQAGLPAFRYKVMAGDIKVEQQRDVYVATLRDVSGKPVGPYAPPRLDYEPWLLAYYSDFDITEPRQYWSWIRERVGQKADKRYRPSSAVRKKAKEIIEGAESEPIRALYDFSLQHSYILAQKEAPTPEAKRKKPKDLLRDGWGYPAAVNDLFAALARAADFEVRPAYIPSRVRGRFDPREPNPYLLDAILPAVRLEGGWGIMDPGSGISPYGLLSWRHTGVRAVVLHENDITAVTTPVADVSQNYMLRVGHFAIDDAGVLMGTVRVRFEGQPAVIWRQLHNRAAEDVADEVTSWAERRLHDALVDSVTVRGLADPRTALEWEFHVRVEHFATLTGKRLLFRALPLQTDEPTFEAETREYPIEFPHPWTQVDSMRFELPAGFELEGRAKADTVHIGRFGECILTMIPGEGAVVWTKRFRLMRDRFQPSAYPFLKTTFDKIDVMDQTTCVLRRGQT